MLNQDSIYQSIFSYLRSLHFHFLDSWVIECVNFYKSAKPGISLEAMKNEVKQQWLLVNLREIKVPSLPPNLKSINKITLDGTYAVQVESMIDSSVSCYSQFQKLLKVSIEDIEATMKPEEREVKPNRCLTFVISDGVQEIEAMEYQPIKKIKSNDPELLPGFKMVITGPVECRKGMILLEDKNVTVYGGEVDTLIVPNSLRNLLIKKLELDESDYPDVGPLGLEKENKNVEPGNKTHGAENLKDECIESLLSQNDDVFLNIPLEPEIFGEEEQPNKNSKTTQNVTNIDNYLFNQNLNYWNEDELNHDSYIINNKKHSLTDEDKQMSNPKRLSFDRELENNKAKLSGWSSGNQDALNFVENDICIDDFNEAPSTVWKDTLKTKKTVQTKVSSFFKNSDSNLNSEHKNLSCSQKPACISEKPFAYLKHVMSVKLNKPAVFTIKAIILTLKKKIKIENDKFNLKVNITDGSANLDVDFCSEILEEFLNFSPCEMAMMLKARQTNSAIAQRVKESFARAQEKLISLNCLMKIKFFTDDKTPVILSLEEVTAQHLKALKERCGS